MKYSLLFILSFFAGALLAFQNSISSQIGHLVKKPIFAAMVAFLISLILSLCYLGFSKSGFPQKEELLSIPKHLYLLSGTMSFLALIVYFYAIPKIGISSVITLGVSGQIIFSIIASHFGLFSSPVERISTQKIIGALLMLSGVYLVNFNLN